jgi:hypothetical protein
MLVNLLDDRAEEQRTILNVPGLPFGATTAVGHVLRSPDQAEVAVRSG